MSRLDEIHNISLEMMKAIRTVCEKHDITFYLDCGTLLGAVRHKDFIPWDDDVDLSMKRADYIKFLSVAHELPAPYKLVLPNEYGGYFFDFVPRVVNMDEPLRPETPEDIAQNNYQNRIAADIFILDDAPVGKLATKIAIFRQKMIYGYAMAHRYNKDTQKHTLFNRVKIKVLGLIGKTMSLEKILKKQEKLSLKYSGSAGDEYIITNTAMEFIDIPYKKESFENSVKLPIGEELFTCPAGYDAVLTAFYGDYMTPPKEEDRRPIHI